MKYLFRFLPMEMGATEGFMKYQIEKLEEENKNLNKQIEQFKKGVKAGTKIIERLEEENKKLKEKLSEITMVADDEKQSIEHILELEKENEELKKQNDRLTTQIAKQLLKNV